MTSTSSRTVAATAMVVVTWSAAAAASTPAPTPYTEWTSEKEIFVRMRDGVQLSTDILLP